MSFFLGIPIFQDLRFRINFLKKNSDFRYHRKMYRLFPCIPIFKGVFLLKVQKGGVYMTMLFLVLALFKFMFLMSKNGISKL